jgi:predicted CXXCH cytochrome family protein
MWSHGRDFIRHDQGSHPIGVVYDDARGRQGAKTDLKPIAMVDRRIRFFNGKVGCGSCHNPYSTIEKRLVMSDRGSELCLACHIM